jgi:DNA-binding SARP family transcriptional activator
MKRFSFSLLGTPQIFLDQTAFSLPTRKTLALLVYTVVERKSIARDKLMTLFWPDSDQEHAQTSLRTTLGYLRRALPPAVFQIERDAVLFVRGENVSIDTDTLLDAAKSAARPQLRQSTLIPVFRAAAEHIQGEFLSGFSVDGASDFDNWLAMQREFFHQQAVRVFNALSQLQLETGLYFEGLHTTTKWIDFDPLDEAAYQRQMQLYLAGGNRIAALQSYKSLSLMLSNEFGVLPSSQSQTLKEQAQTMVDKEKKRLDPEMECIALNRMALSLSQSTYDLEQALNLLRQALHLAGQSDNALYRAETQWNLAQTYFYQGSLESALHHANTALDVARGLGRDDLLGRVLNTIAYVKLWSGVPHTDVIRWVDEAFLIFERLHQPMMQVDCLTIKANSLLSKGFPAQGFQCAKEALSLSETTQNDWGIASASYNLGLALLDQGQIQFAQSQSQRGILCSRTAGHPPLVFFNLLVLGHIEREAGQYDQALNTHSEALQLGMELQSPYFQFLVATELCADYLSLQNTEKAAENALVARELRLRVPYSDYTRYQETEALLHADYRNQRKSLFSFVSSCVQTLTTGVLTTPINGCWRHGHGQKTGLTMQGCI